MDPKDIFRNSNSKIQVTDVTLRDGHQSIMATRMRTDHIKQMIGMLDDIGFAALEVWGGATFDVMTRYLNEDPWQRIRDLKKVAPKTPFMMLLRGQNLVGYRNYPDDVVKEFVRHSAKSGIDIFRVFDALNDHRNFESSFEAIQDAGKHIQGTICYSVTEKHMGGPVFTLEYFVEKAKVIEKMGGAVAAVENSYMKNNLVKSMSQRVSAIENAEQIVVGVNKFKETTESPLKDDKEGFIKIDPKAEKEQINKLKNWRKKRNESKCILALKKLKELASQNKNIMETSIECAHAGVTTGEWTDTLRKIYGEYRAPTGVSKHQSHLTSKKINERVNKISSKLKRRIKLLIGKPGLDGHSSGAEQIAVAARDVGMEVVYEGIRLTPKQIVNTAIEESVHMIALSILSGSHFSLTKEIVKLMKRNNLSKVPLVVGGIIPLEDEKKMLQLGVSKIYTPKNYDINSIMNDFVEILEKKY